jgi:hypothetical protein
MRRLLERLERWAGGAWGVLLALAGLGVLSYGLLAPRMGFYWDDFPITWIRETYGAAGLARYFSTNRPLWGLLYQASDALLGANPLATQVFGLAWRWAAAVMFWLLLRTVWPARAHLAGWAAAAWMVYPAFSQQFIGLVYGHFFIVLTAFFASLWMTVRALRSGQRAWLWTVGALLLGAVNLLTLEYFFVLELARPLLVWCALGDEVERRARLRRTVRVSLPYLILFLGAAVWRGFFFTYQTQNYDMGLLAQLQAAPWATVVNLLTLVGRSLWNSTIGGWLLGFRPPDVDSLGRLTTLLWAGALLAGAALAGWLALGGRKSAAGGKRAALEMIAVGAALLLLAGPPFWLTGLHVELHFPIDRFTLAFAPGACLALAGVLGLGWRWQWAPRVVFALLIGLAVGVQVQNASAYRREWDDTQAMFWQLSWRAPQLTPGTIVISNDLPLSHWSDNSLTAPLNWVYAADNDSTEMDFLWYYATVRQNTTLPKLQPGLVVAQDYLAAHFTGNSSDAVSVYYNPPACLRVLDAEVESENGMLPLLMRDASVLTNLARIEVDAGSRPLDLTPVVFGVEPAHGWCYYFEAADLARQQSDWQRVAELGDTAFALGDAPNDPAERLVFIEGYAHVDRWDDALALTRTTADITPLMEPVLCRLWARIGRDTAESTDKANTSATVQAELACPTP